MRGFSPAVAVSRWAWSPGLALIALLLGGPPSPAGAASAAATATVRPPLLQKNPPPQDDARAITREDEEFEALNDLASLRARGVPLAEHEIEILEAWQAGFAVAQIEADALLSGAIYRRFVEGSATTVAERDLIRRWLAYRADHALEILGRGVELNGGGPGDVRAPDGTREWELYWDPELYNQLSSAYQQRLQRIYGYRGGVRRGAAPAAPGAATPASPAAPLVNVLVNNPAADATAQDTQSETALVLGSGSTVIASFNDSGSFLGGASSFTGIARSTDGGATFTDQGAPPVSAQGDAGDPVLARNNVTGRAILTTLGFNSATALQSFRTDDDGATYQAPVECDGGGLNNDKEWLACDNFGGAGQGNFYLYYRDFGAGGGMSFTRSTDGGATWSGRQLLASGSGQGAWVTVGADHAVYAFWLAGSSIVLRKSTDQGVTWGSQSTAQTLRTTGVNGDLALTGGFRSNAFPQVASNPNDASQLYMVWNDKGVVPSPDKANVYFSRSTDGGATWAAALQVNADAGTNDNWQPVLAITPDGTGLFVSWYDRRRDPVNAAIDVFARAATISGTTVTFGNDYRVTDASFPVVIGQDPAINSVYMGDYDTAVADNSDYYRTWGDNRLARLSHAHQPDVRFARIPKAGPGAIANADGSALTAESCTPGNGAVDPSEFVTVSFAVRNVGTAPTSNLVGTLLESGGVTGPSAPKSFGAIAVDGTASRSFTFTAASLACGASLTATLQLQDGAENLGTVTYALPLGTIDTGTSTTATYSSGPLAVAIPASGTVGDMADQIAAIADVGAVADANLRVRLNHTFDGDLVLSAQSPDGAAVTLANRRGSSGDNFGSGATDCTGTFTTFDDAAGTPIGAGTAPFAGSFQPDSPLSGLIGRPVAGNWSFKINDAASGDSGTLFCWQLEITRNPYLCAATCSALFSDDFETGASCRWSSSVASTSLCP